jgi:hypothetical protein
MMQAFLWRHLAPSETLMVLVKGGRFRSPPIELAGGLPVRIPVGGSARIRLKTPPGPMIREAELKLSDPPEGLTLEEVDVVPGGLALRLAAGGETLAAGYADNLIVEAFRDYKPKAQPGKPAPPKRRVSLGVLPAIPIEIVQR